MSRMLKALKRLDAKRRDEMPAAGVSQTRSDTPSDEHAAPQSSLADVQTLATSPETEAASLPAVSPMGTDAEVLAPRGQDLMPTVERAGEAQISPPSQGAAAESLLSWVSDSMPGLSTPQPASPGESVDAEVEAASQDVPISKQPEAEGRITETSTSESNGVAANTADEPTVNLSEVDDELSATAEDASSADTQDASVSVPTPENDVAELELSNTSESTAALESSVIKAGEPPASSRPATGEALLKNHFVGPPPEPPPPATEFERRINSELQDAQIGAAYRQIVENITADYSGIHPVSLIFVSPELGRDVGELISHMAPLLTDDVSKQRILLVDADLETKTLSQISERGGQSGLVEVLSRHKNWRDYVVRTSHEYIDMLPAGQGEVTSYKTVGDRLSSVIRELNEEYTFVLFDTGGAKQPLTAVLAPVADAAYVLIQLHETETEVASAAINHLQTAGARCRGCIVRGAA